MRFATICSDFIIQNYRAELRRDMERHWDSWAWLTVSSRQPTRSQTLENVVDAWLLTWPHRPFYVVDSDQIRNLLSSNFEYFQPWEPCQIGCAYPVGPRGRRGRPGHTGPTGPIGTIAHFNEHGKVTYQSQARPKRQKMTRKLTHHHQQTHQRIRFTIKD
jgi:hypothetical protein